MSKASRLLALCVWLAAGGFTACGDDTSEPAGMAGSGGAGNAGAGAGGSSGNAGTSAGEGGASGAMSGAGGTSGSGGNGGTAGTSSGNGGDGGSSGVGGDGGTSGDGGGGDSGASGDGGTGGDAGMGGAMTYDPADHCDPGTYIPPEMFGFSNEPDHASTCNDADHVAAGEAGVFEGTPEVRVFVRTIQLSTPMTAGEPYAMSFEVDFDGLDGAMGLELWGTTARCGMDATATMLSETVLVSDKQTVCADVTPTEAYTHVLLVLRDQDDVRPEGMQSTALAGATFCAAGVCP
jgi:hypothetical protein